MDAECRTRSNQLDAAVSFREPLGQTKVMQIRQGAITHEVCCLAAQLFFIFNLFLDARAEILKITRWFFWLI